MKSKDQNKTIAVGGGRKLKDYPAVPGTPPPELKKDKDVVCLEREREREKAFLSLLKRENEEIEKILQNLERELNYVKNNFPQNLDGDGKIHADNDHWFKYEAQMEVNRKLERERRHLESEIKQMEDQGMINLDSLTQSELILYVKQLERSKTDLLSDLRAKEWSLDKQAKDFHHLNETKRALEAEIKHYDGESALYHHYKRISCPSASASIGRQPPQDSARRMRPMLRNGRIRACRKSVGSVSHENLSQPREGDVMFRSLDEPKLDELKRTSQEQMKRGVVAGTERAKTPERKSLREVSKQRVKTPTKTVRGKVDKIPKSTIRIIVTDETDQTETEVDEIDTGRTESGIGSPSDYEDDFEESEQETQASKKIPEIDGRRKRFGSATWRM